MYFTVVRISASFSSSSSNNRLLFLLSGTHLSHARCVLRLLLDSSSQYAIQSVWHTRACVCIVRRVVVICRCVRRSTDSDSIFSRARRTRRLIFVIRSDVWHSTCHHTRTWDFRRALDIHSVTASKRTAKNKNRCSSTSIYLESFFLREKNVEQVTSTIRSGHQ